MPQSMVSEPQSVLSRQLVQTFAAISSTEKLIIYVAGTDSMLPFCQNLIEEYDRDTRSPLVREVNGRCAALAVLPGALFAEVRKVLLALNRYHDAGRDHYGVLGLEPDASKEEIKKAYRQLSKEHHPDKRPDAQDGAQQFMEIAGAYHALMAARTEGKADAAVPWRRQSGRSVGRRKRDQKIFFSAMLVIILVLAAASIYIAGRHNQQIILTQLQANEYDSPAAATKPAQTPLPVREQPPARPADPVQAAPVPQPAAIPPEPLIPAASTEPQAAEKMSPDPQPTVAPTLLPAQEVTGAEPAVLLPSEPEPAETAPLPGAEPQIVSGPAPAETTVMDRPAIAPPRAKQPEAGDRTAAIRKKIPTENPAAKNDRIQTINTSLEISSLIHRYSRLYTHRELDPFLALFAQGATENNQPVTSFTDQYRSLFTHTRSIDLAIDDIAWEEYRDGFQAEGSFRASYTYNDGRKKDHAGDITFYLTREQGALKIKSLHYVFAE